MWKALALLVTLSACTDHGAGALAKIKDEVCACKTSACAEQAMARVPKETIESNRRTQGLARGMLDCVARLQAAERPSTDPDSAGSSVGSGSN